jgi:hypothetical protein
MITPLKSCENCGHMEMGPPEMPCYSCKGWRYGSDMEHWTPREVRG